MSEQVGVVVESCWVYGHIASSVREVEMVAFDLWADSELKDRIASYCISKDELIALFTNTNSGLIEDFRRGFRPVTN